MKEFSFPSRKVEIKINGDSYIYEFSPFSESEQMRLGYHYKSFDNGSIEDKLQAIKALDETMFKRVVSISVNGESVTPTLDHFIDMYSEVKASIYLDVSGLSEGEKKQ